MLPDYVYVLLALPPLNKRSHLSSVGLCESPLDGWSPAVKAARLAQVLCV